MSTYSKEQVIELLKDYEKELTYDDWKYTMQKMNTKIKHLEVEENPKIQKLKVKLSSNISEYGEDSKMVQKIYKKIDKQTTRLLNKSF